MSRETRDNAQVITSRDAIPCPTCGKPSKKFVKTYGERARCEDCDEKRMRDARASVHSHRAQKTKFRQDAVFDFATTLDYPRPYCHGETNGLGWPLLTGSDPVYANRPIDNAFLQSYGRFPLCMLSNYPFMQFRADVGASMKTFNPNCHVVWWHTLTQIIQAYGDLNALWRDQYDSAISPIDVRLYRNDGLTWPFGNPAGSDVCFHDQGVIRAQNIADLAAAGAGTLGVADGFHIDFAESQFNTGLVLPTDLDITRTQWATLAELNASMRLGLNAVVDYMNTTRGRKCVFCNGGTDNNNQGEVLDHWMGRFFEGYGSEPMTPFYTTNWTNFDEMMASPVFTRWQGAGIDGGGTIFLKAEESTRTYSATYNRLGRFIMGLSCLVGGYACVNWDHPPAYPGGGPPYSADRWADEYSVTNGTHDQTAAGCGYLGRPIEVAYKDAGGLWARRFQRGIALVNGGRIGVDGSKTITLEKPYRRILGLRDPAVNDGTSTSSVTIPAHDGRILLTI